MRKYIKKYFIIPARLLNQPSFLSNWYQRLFLLGVQQPRREADQSPPTSANVKKIWDYTPILQIVWINVLSDGIWT
jgi:hypothetical protein